MVTITRNEARQLRNLLRRAGLLGRNADLHRPLEVLAGSDGLFVRCQNQQTAIAYHQPDSLPEARLVLPAKVLEDCWGRDDSPITLETATATTMAARWTENGIPQCRSYDEVTDQPTQTFPALPEDFAENPPGTLNRLDDAGQICADASARFTLTNLQLRSKQRQVVTTDGRHALQQSGFSFPWHGDLLVPRNRVFGSKELDASSPVQIGRIEKWVVFQVAPWTIWLAIDSESRFPRTDDLWPIHERATSRVELTEDDARFLAARIGCLPGDQTVNFPVTLDLNGEVIVRGKSIEQPQPTDLVLCGSHCTGLARRVNTSRMFVARALELGFREFLFFGDSSPVLAIDGQRQYLWMPLVGADAIAPSADAIRILSSDVGPPGNGSQRGSRLAKPRGATHRMMNETNATNGNGHTNGHSTGNGRSADHSQSGTTEAANGSTTEASATVLEQVHALRGVLRDALSKSNDLIRSLKRQKRQSRLVESTLASLRQLQSIDD